MKITKSKLKQIIVEELTEMYRLDLGGSYASYEDEEDPKKRAFIEQLFKATRRAIELADDIAASEEVMAALENLSEPAYSSDDLIGNYMRTMDDIKAMAHLDTTAEDIFMTLDDGLEAAYRATGRG